MVFESVLAGVINRLLKPYVKKLDTSQLKLGIWGGNAHTHDIMNKLSILTGNVSHDKLELKEDLFVSTLHSQH